MSREVRPGLTTRRAGDSTNQTHWKAVMGNLSPEPRALDR